MDLDFRDCFGRTKLWSYNQRNMVLVSIIGSFMVIYSILFHPITLEGCRGTTDEFATIPFHLDLFSAALVYGNHRHTFCFQTS